MKIVFLNINRINYDKKFNLEKYMLNDDIKFYDYTDKGKILNNIADAEIVVIKELKLDKEIISSLPNTVKLIIEAGTGYNNIDIESCKKRGIKVANVPEYSTNNVALFTIMLLLNMSVSFHEQEKMFLNNDFRNFSSNLLVGYTEISGKTLGIIGMGKIGSKVAEFANALSMNIIYYSRTKKVNKYEYVSLEELLKRSDYISLHTSLDNDSFHMINEENIKLIKNTAFIINTARGALIDEKSLINALKNNNIKGAALDVLENEPLEINNELIKLDNVILTPHMAWNSYEARERLIKDVFETINMYKKGIDYNIVN